jgi:hypothetical protein
MYLSREELKEPEFIAKYGSLYEGIDDTKLIPQLTSAFNFCQRRFLLALLIWNT